MTECYACAKLAELVAENNALRVRVDELANGNDGETNVITSGSPLVDELPKGDVPSEFAEILMALAADCSCMGDGIVRHFEPKDVQGDVDALMRVVERDYVRRAAYNSLKELTTNSDKWLKNKLEEARAERDEWKAKAETRDDGAKQSMTNLDWLMENDFEALQNQMGGQPCSCCMVGCEDDLGSDEACSAALREWLLSPHVDANDEDMAQDTRKKLEDDVLAHAEKAFYGDGTLRTGNSHMRFATVDDVIGWLDRQAAITEREIFDEMPHVRDRLAEQDSAIVEYAEKNAELTEQLEAAHAKNRSLRTHISKMQEGRHGWHVKGVELQREVDKLARENISLARDLSECMAERDSWRYRWHQVRVLMDEPLQCDRATLVDIDGEVVG